MKKANPQTAHILASVAHDLRSPLNAVIGFSRILLKGIDGPLSDLQTADLEAIHDNGTAMLQMVDSVIDLAKAEAGWLAPATTGFHVSPLLEQMRSQQERIQVVDLPRDALPLVYADQAQVQKALERAIAVAVHLSAAGTVTVTPLSRREDLVIEIVCSAPEGFAPDTPQILAGFQSSGASQEHRVTAVGLHLLASQCFLALNGGSLQIEVPAETALIIRLALPSTPRRS